jgi:hypothetical protein
MATKTKRQPNITIQGILKQYLGGMLNPQQQRAQARKDTNLAMQQSMRELRQTYGRERERTLREQYAQGMYAGVLRGAAAPGSADEAAIKAAYARAAGLTGAEQRGFINPTTAQQQTNTDAASTVAQQAAGYEGDVAAITPGAATGAQQAGVNNSVLTYLSSLPAGTFAAEAEAAAKGANRANVTAAGEFAGREAMLGQTLREMQDKYTSAVADLKAGRASSLQEALGNYREGNRQDYATLLSGLGLLNTQQGNLLDYATDTAKLTQSQKDAKRKAMAARGMDINGKPLPGYYKDPKTGRVLKTGEYIAGDGSVQKVPQGWRSARVASSCLRRTRPRAARAGTRKRSRPATTTSTRRGTRCCRRRRALRCTARTRTPGSRGRCRG